MPLLYMLMASLFFIQLNSLVYFWSHAKSCRPASHTAIIHWTYRPKAVFSRLTGTIPARPVPPSLAVYPSFTCSLSAPTETSSLSQ